MRPDDPNLPHLLVIADALGELREHVVFTWQGSCWPAGVGSIG